jgi:hypothetical protein
MIFKLRKIKSVEKDGNIIGDIIGDYESKIMLPVGRSITYKNKKYLVTSIDRPDKGERIANVK